MHCSIGNRHGSHAWYNPSEVSFMTYDWFIGRRRVAAAVLGTPDCVPIYAALTEHARYLFGIPARTFYTVPEVFVEAQLLVSEYYGLDLPAVHGDVINIEAEALGRKVIYRPRQLPVAGAGAAALCNIAQKSTRLPRSIPTARDVCPSCSRSIGW